MKKITYISIISLLICGPLNACLNMISNNTGTTFKLAEVKADNADLKKQILLPEEYVKDEEKAHTLQPGDEIAFGGHYVPTFIIYKEYSDKKWHPLMVVKQLRCGPRGPENKYLLMTDLLKRKLPDDYQEVYKFSIKCDPSELNVASTNEKELTKVANPYQELLNILDNSNQKILELFGQVVSDKNECQASKKSLEPTQETKEAVTTPEAPAQEGESCEKCNNILTDKK